MNIIISDSQNVFAESLRKLCNEVFKTQQIQIVSDFSKFEEHAIKYQNSVLLFDPFTSFGFSFTALTKILALNNRHKIVCITDCLNEKNISNLLNYNINYLIAKQCSEDDIRKGLSCIFINASYFCPNIATIIIKQNFKTQKRIAEKKNEDTLTKKEIQIAQLISDGKTTKEISSESFISINTVNTHRKNIFRKLGVNNSAEMIIECIKLGVIDKIEYYI